MHKNKQTWSVKTLVFLALLVAIQLVLSRVLVIDLGVYRIMQTEQEGLLVFKEFCLLQ